MIATARFLTVRQVREWLGLSKAEGVLALIHSGLLPATNISTGVRATWRIQVADFEQFLIDRRAVPPQKPERPSRRKKLRGITEFFK